MTFQDLPIKRKVMAAIMVTSVTALLLTTAVFMIYDLATFRNSMVRNLRTLSAVVADNSSASLIFKTEKEARETLESLRAERHVIAAAVYDGHDNLFVRYPITEPVTAFPLKSGQPGHHFEGEYLIMYAPIMQDNNRQGTLYLKSDVGALYTQLRLYAGIAVLILVGSTIVALLMSNALQKRITHPILSLAETARLVSERRDYSVRAQKVSQDEFGVLTDAFNQMLIRIEHQTVALRQGEEQLRLALEASRTGTWDWNLTTNRMNWDEYNHHLYGLSPIDFAGTYARWLELIHPEDRSRVEHALRHAVERKTELNAEFRVIWPDGSLHHIATRGKALYDEHGNAVRMNGVSADITQRKQGDANRSFLAAIVESSSDAIVGKDLQSRVVSWNAGAERMFGYTAKEIIGEPILKLVSPDRPDEESRILEEVQRGSTRHLETIRIHKDGHAIDVSLTVSPILDAQGQIIGISSVARDISERKRSEEALERQAAVLREQAQMLDLANVLARDLEDRIILWNSGMEKMYGWSRSEALGQVSHQLLQTELGHPLDLVRAALFKHGRWEGEVVHTRKDGKKIFVSSQWVVHKDEHGNPSAILEVNNDLTERKQAEQEVIRVNVELEQRVQARTTELTVANKELEAFTYSVAHDLRAPLRHIDAFSKILNDDFAASLPPEAKRYLDNIRNGSRNMSRLVDDLLNLARVGRQELKVQPTPLTSLVEEVMSDLKRETEGRHVQWRIHPLPIVMCDSGLMKQVFANLLANAVKYTRPRSVAVIEIGHEQVNGHTTVFIRDNGVGFNMKYADKLFGVFQRLHRSEDFEGTGVGLATVDRIVRKHGGAIWAEAAVDKGATFYFTVSSLEKKAGKLIS
jgi:PAS domain S-box-containing protein